MNVDVFVEEVRGVVNDSTDTTKNANPTYSDNEIVNRGSHQCQSLARVQIEKTRGFHNATMVMQAAEARQLYTQCWQYTLPSWVSSVMRVHERQGTSAVGEDTLSPYVWTGNAIPITTIREIPKWRRESNLGYTWDGVRTLRLYGFPTAVSLVIDIAKLPPPLVKFTLAENAADTSHVWIPDTPTLGRVPIEMGAFLNAELSITKAATIANYGIVRRVVYSSSTDITGPGGTRRNRLTFEAAVPAILSQTDIVQSLLPFGDEHCRCAVLMTAHALFTRENNIPGQKAISEELRLQLEQFTRFADKKDYDGPEFWRPRVAQGSTRVTDRASSLHGGWI